MKTDDKTSKTISSVEDGLKSDITKPTVYYFQNANFSGDCTCWDLDLAVTDHLDNEPNLYKQVSSLLVTHGQCEVTSTSTQKFTDNSGYFNADAGVNSGGIFPNLADYGWSDKITALRVQRDDIYRSIDEPYLVIRDKKYAAGGKAIILKDDNPSITAFPAVLLFCMGSPSRSWYLYSEENYQGESMIVSVDDGYNSQGVYKLDDAFTVRSARSSNGMPPSEFVDFDQYLLAQIAIKNSLNAQIKGNINREDEKDLDINIFPGESYGLYVDKDSTGLPCIVCTSPGGYKVNGVSLDGSTEKHNFITFNGYTIDSLIGYVRRDGYKGTLCNVSSTSGFYYNYLYDDGGIENTYEYAVVFQQSIETLKDGTLKLIIEIKPA